MAPETIFSKILKGEIPSDEVYSDEEFYAFRDVNPVAPTHILIVPRKEIPKIADAGEDDAELLGRMLLRANHIARQEGLHDWRFVINNGAGAGQSVFHLHLHILGGLKTGEGNLAG